MTIENERPTEQKIAILLDDLIDAGTAAPLLKTKREAFFALIRELLYPPAESPGSILNQLMDKVDELVNASMGAAEAAQDGDMDGGDFVDMRRTALQVRLRAALRPPYVVYVSPLHASNGVTYVVILERTNVPKTIQNDDAITSLSVINRNDVNEANEEGRLWANFLGVGFTPCKAVEDTVDNNTVPEYGDQLAVPTEKQK